MFRNLVQLACPVPEETSTWIRKGESSEGIDDQAGDLIEKIKTPRLEESSLYYVSTPLFLRTIHSSLISFVMVDLIKLNTAPP